MAERVTLSAAFVVVSVVFFGLFLVCWDAIGHSHIPAAYEPFFYIMDVVVWVALWIMYATMIHKMWPKAPERRR